MLRRRFAQVYTTTKECAKIAFTYGEVECSKDNNVIFIQQQQQQQQQLGSTTNPNYNGLISSIELFVFIVTLSATTSLSPYIGKNSDGTTTQVVLIILMLVGLIVMTCFYKFQNTQLERKDKPLSIRGLLTLIGVVLFYIFGCFLDLFHAITIMNCVNIYQVCRGYIYYSNIVSIAFHLLRIIYLAAETILCIMFRGAKFFDKCTVRYGLMILQASNLALWFDILLRESAYRLAPNFDNSTASMNSWCSHLVENMTDGLNCLNLNTSLHSVLRTRISQNLYPFLYQFSLLVGECLVFWFTKCKSSSVSNEQSNSQANEKLVESSIDPTTGTGSGIGETGRTVEGATRYGSCRRGIRSRTRSGDESVTSSNEVSQNTTRNRIGSNEPSESFEETTPLVGTRPPSQSILFKLCFLFSIVLNLLFALFNFLPLTTSDTNRKKYNRVFFNYCIFYWLINILSVFLGYYCVTEFRTCSPKKKFRSLDYLLTLSSIGAYIYVVTSVICISRLMYEYPSARFEEEHVLRPSTYLAMEITFLVSIYFQIPFCFLAGRVVVPEPSSTTSQSNKVSSFKVITLHLAVSNGTLWIIDSFTTTFNTQHIYIQAEYFDQRKWMLVSNFILPLVLFFRFNSCLLFTRANLRFTEFFRRKRSEFST